MSEELLQTAPINIGRYQYYKLGSTTLSQLKKKGLIRRTRRSIQNKKPDGLILLPGGNVKAVIEYKQPSELRTESLVRKAIEQELEVARFLCKILIVSDGQKTYWINALNGEHILRGGKRIDIVFNAQRILEGKITVEELTDLEYLIDQADYSLTEDNNHIREPEVLDPTALAKQVWQKIWINTGKEPEKCLYNVVEIFVFKFLSDIGVLGYNNSFQFVYDLKEKTSDIVALKHYADRCRKDIKEMFPEGDDGTTILNGTIFVNEQGKANLSQASLFGEVLDCFQAYDDQYGSFKYVTKEFKTRLYETFLRQSAGIKRLGQYFTPRNVVQAMVKMSNAKYLQKGARICDPFCGVGGFILETILLESNIWREFVPVNQSINPGITLLGYDKGTDEKDDERTIILAKANMLIYFSDLLSKYHSKEHLQSFTENALNKVFHLLRSNLGTFGMVNEEKFDLILTNPPYVTSGSSSIKKAIEDEGLSDYYSISGRGTEALAIQWIVKNLKKGGQALVVVPDGLLNQESILDFLMQECIIEAIISLPVRTFYATPKKTYILVITKKNNGEEQLTPVFTYLVSEIGETRDSKRFPIEQNDLEEAVQLFNQFKAAPQNFRSDSLRCKKFTFSYLKEQKHWMVDRWWSDEEKQKLGIIEESIELSEEEFYSLVAQIQKDIKEILKENST